MAELGDLVELTVDIPKRNLRVGLRGTIVHNHNDQAFEVEFTNEDGETLDFLALYPQQFIVVWQVKTHQWVPLREQVMALITKLPVERVQEILDFAHFLMVNV